MNQILVTNFNNKFNNKKGKEYKKIFKVQFIISITIIVFAICFFIYYLYSLETSENFSKKIISNYNISTLYSSNGKNNETESLVENSIFGIIEIPKINIYYPVFSFLSKENLKVSPCKLYGTNLNENTNICIAGHNYNNDMFFSNIDKLQNGDEIYIYNNNGFKYIYKVFGKYEVKENDLSPIYNYNKNEKTLTLVTCNNLNNNRIIIKAKQNKE